MMKPTVTILVCVLAAGWVSAQSPRATQNTRSTTNAVSKHATAASNQAPAAAKSSGTAAAAPAHAHSAGAKRRDHARRGGAIYVGQIAAPAPAAAPQAEAPADANLAATPEGGDGQNAENSQGTADSKYAANGRRDPFVSPVVSHAGGSGCSTGKKCLEIGAINLRGVVHA